MGNTRISWLLLLVGILGWQGVVPGGAEAQASALALRFAPRVIMHPEDRHRPASVEWFIERSVLRDGAGALLDADPQPHTLPWGRTDLYLDADESSYLGMPLRDIGSGQARVDAPMYVRTKQGDGFTELTYAFFYPFNGCQMFRVGLHKVFSTKKRNFPWCDFARHQGDWEQVSVRVSGDGSRVLGVFLAQHGEGQYLTADKLSFEGTHPIVYSAMHSHATYGSEGTFTNAEIDAVNGWPALIGPIRWLKVIDTTETADLVVYDSPSPHYGRVEWRAWERAGQLVPLEGLAWVGFAGKWGRGLDNSNVRKPPDMWASGDDYLGTLGKIASFLGAIPDKYKDSGAPSGPIRKSWWSSFVTQ